MLVDLLELIVIIILIIRYNNLEKNYTALRRWVAILYYHIYKKDGTTLSQMMKDCEMCTDKEILEMYDIRK